MTSSGWSDMPQKSTRFFKIVLTDVGSHTKLLFPKEFLRIFGKNLKDSIMLNVPSGLEGSIDLKKHKGKVWLQTGWPEFADFYSIGFGYLLVFEYKGDSKFKVLIFDPSSLEIDYPLARNDKPSAVKSAQVKERLMDIDDSSSSDNLIRPCKKKKATFPSSEASPKLEQEKAKAADKVDKDRALAVANAFKSKNRFFVHVVKESHTVGGGWPNVYIPKGFKEAYNWQSNQKLILVVEGRSWVVFCNLNLDCNQCRISRGWTIFARENSLNVGDVCVFELISGSSKRFQVFISRASKETNCEGNERLPRVRDEADKARVLKSLKDYKPNRPFFKVKVHRSYLYGGSMTVPVEFIKRRITHDSCSVVLQLPDGRDWSVKCYINKKCAKFSAGWKNFSTENNLAAAAGSSVVAIDLRTMKKVFSTPYYPPSLYSFEILPSKSLICTGGMNSAMLWDMRTFSETVKAKPLGLLDGHIGPVKFLHMDRNKVVSGSPEDQFVNVWESDTGRQTNILDCNPTGGLHSSAGCSAMAVNGCEIVTGSCTEGQGVIRYRDFNYATSQVLSEENEGGSKFWGSQHCSDSYESDS